MAGETEYEASPMSYTTLINIAISGQHVDRIELPPYTELYEYTIWYLRSLNPYTMLVHRPVFLDLIWKIGNDPNFTPTAPEIVTVHMMLATHDSHAHYHYALTFYSKLIPGDHGWQDVQALAMICHHLRTFPKPGAAWIMTSTVYLFALQLGLHRSVK
ncbi:transcription factor Cys6, partial [Pyrenophora tritici-repentis]